MASKPSAPTSWASLINDSNKDVDDVFILPQPVVIQKGRGIEEKTSYEKRPFKDGFKYVKIVECSQIRKRRKRISKKAILREKLQKFGKPGQDGVQPGQLEKGITTACPPIMFEWEHEKDDEDDGDDNIILNQLHNRTQADIIMKDIIPTHIQLEKPSEVKKKKSWMKSATEDIGPIEETPTIRILDIPTNASYDDVKELVRRFNSQRVSLPRDHDGINANRGVAYISFYTHDSALKAKDALNGHPYGNLILRTEWSRNYMNFMKAQKKAGIDVTNAQERRRGRPRFTNSSRV